jgi:hypothetical protein
MRKVFLVIGFVFAISMVTYAQKGNNQVGIGPDVYFGLKSFGDAYGVGVGGHVKGLYGVGSAGQATLTIGYASFSGKSSTLYKDYKFAFIPVLLGYRQNFDGLFIEPQLGFNSSHTKYNGTTYDKVTSFTYAIGGGYAKNGFEVSLSFQNIGLTGQIALRGGVAYNIPLGKK